MLTTNFRPKRKTIFYTFYSFKGGVGRTMSLINVACILAARGRRVLMIDFDLEAPGLTNLALRDIATEADRQRDGLVELIQDFVDAPENSPLADETNRAPFFDKYVRQLHIPDTLEPLEGGSLHLLPCGRIDATYTERLYAIDFKQLYAEGVGQPLFKYLKTYIRDAERYDYVLIDSRTGFSDEGGICTRDLADHIFIITGLNRQNIDGTVQFLRQLEASGWQEGQLVFVASPVPTGLEELRDQRIKAAKAAIEQTRFKADFKLLIPYHPRLALDEEPFIYRWSATDLFPSYQRLARVLRDLANDGPEGMSQEVTEALQKRQFPQALTIARQLAVEEPTAAMSLLTAVTTNFVDAPKEWIDEAEPFFHILLDIDDSAEQHRRFGAFLVVREQYGRAQECLTTALHRFELQNDEYGIARTLLMLGHTHIHLSDFQDGLSAYEQANTIFVKFNDEEGLYQTTQYLGFAHGLMGKYKEAIRLLTICVQRGQDRNDVASLPYLFAATGTMFLLLGNYQVASSMAQEALEHSQQANNDDNIASALNLFSGIHLDLKKYDLAYSISADVSELYIKAGNRRGSASTQATLGYIKVCQGNFEGLATIENAVRILEELGHNSSLARGHTIYAEALLHSGNIPHALSNLEQHWDFVQRYAEAQVRYEAYVTRSKVKAALGDTQGAAEDAQVAVDFYREQGVHTLLAQEAEELAKLNAAQDADVEINAS